MTIARTLALVVALAGGCGFDPAHLPSLTFGIAATDAWPVNELLPPPAPGEGRVYVTNNLDDTVSILDLDSVEAGQPQLLANVPVGFVPVEREGPHHISADAAGEFYYFGISNFVPGSGSGPHGVHGAGTADGHMMKMRVDDNTLVASVRVEPNPGDVRLTPDGATLLASHFDMVKVTKAAGEGITSGPELDSSLAIVDPQTMTRKAFVPACPAAHGIAITADSATAVMSCISDEVAIVDLATHAVTRFPIVDPAGTAIEPQCAPYAMTIDGNTAWASCYNQGTGVSGRVIAVDAVAKVLDGRFMQLQGAAVFGDVKDGVMAIAHQNVDGVTFFETAGPTFHETKVLTPDVCVLPHAARWSADGTKVYVVCEGNKSDRGTFVVLDGAAPHDVLGQVECGIFPDDIATMRRAP